MQPSSATFHHPFQPYEIQLQFMNDLYRCIDDGDVGIFESPTGTGKSLSLLCGSLTWLRDSQGHAIEEELKSLSMTDEPEWMIKSAQDEKRECLLRQALMLEDKLIAVRLKETDSRARKLSKGPLSSKRAKLSTEAEDEKDSNVMEALEPEDYDSADDRLTSYEPSTRSGLSAATEALLGKLLPSSKIEEDTAGSKSRILYCSRTHSQLSQLISELRRVHLPSAVQREHAQGQEIRTMMTKHVPLGSRKHLCIHPQVSKLSSVSAMNEKCLDLQKPDVSKDKRCPFLPKDENTSLKEDFQFRALAEIRDIEDLAKLGKDVDVCPYYGSRLAAELGEIVTLPYPLLLQKSAREALGISLKDHVVVIDEAHNLMDAITGINAVSITLAQIESVTENLTSYAQYYKGRMKGSNRSYVTQIIRLLYSIAEGLKKHGRGKYQDGILTSVQLMAGKNVDQINPHKLTRYLHKSKLLRKVEGFVEGRDKKAGIRPDSHPSVANDLMLAQSLMVVLVNPSREGRFFFTTQGSDVTLRYTLLDPENAFRDIVEQAKAVILAGGTMSPMSDYRNLLFSYLPAENLRTFSYGHVVPPSNLLVHTVSHGPSDVLFDFTYEHRTSDKVIHELGTALHHLSSTIPDGIVVFFPSYDYLSLVLTRWSPSLFAHKPLFTDSKTAKTDTLLTSYSTSIDTGKGGLLLSVVGGKLSEGINFSDRLGRAVVMVGLPFPNTHTAEWRAKLEYIENRQSAQPKPASSSSSRDHVENVCMRAVNQCIGRAIRHREDYAAIYLLDRRYRMGNIREKLPAWIKGSLGADKAFEGVVADTEVFFAGKA